MKLTPKNPETLQLAAKLLAASPLSVQGLREKLLAKGEAAEDADDAINLLVSSGFLNESMSLQTVLAKSEGKKWGAERIRQSALSLGFPEDLIEAHLATLANEDFNRAWEYATSRHCLGNPPAKIARQLASKGFEQDTVELVIQKLEEESGD